MGVSINGGTPSHHPFRTMGFSLTKTIHLGISTWLWKLPYNHVPVSSSFSTRPGGFKRGQPPHQTAASGRIAPQLGRFSGWGAGWMAGCSDKWPSLFFRCIRSGWKEMIFNIYFSIPLEISAMKSWPQASAIIKILWRSQGPQNGHKTHFPKLHFFWGGCTHCFYTMIWFIVNKEFKGTTFDSIVNIFLK